MIRVIISPSCQSCRKTVKYFADNQIPIRVTSITSGHLTPTFIKEILAAAPHGVEDIISRRSKYIQTKKVRVNELSLDQLVDLAVKQPSVLKRPIIFQKGATNRRLMVGYNATDIEIFLRDAEYERSYFKENTHCYTGDVDLAVN